MDGLIDIAAARSLVASPLWPRLRDFLWRFPSQIHPSRTESLVVRWFGSLAVQENDPTTKPSNHQTTKPPNYQTLSRSPRLSRWLASEFEVEPCFHDFPSTDLSRLLLLDSATLESIALWLGALSTADALRRVTDSATVRALKTALPGIYPDLFSYTAYFAKLLPPTSTDTTPSAIRTLGFTLLYAPLSTLPSPLLHRLHLKLPSDAPAPTTLPPSDHPTTQPPNHQTTKPPNHQTLQLLLKLRFPEAHALCFS